MTLTRIVLGTLITSALHTGLAAAEPLAAGPAAAEPAPTTPALGFVIAPQPASSAPATHGATFGMTGIRFGGIIGGSLETTLALRPDWPVEPELGAAVGISGTKFSLGGRWSLGERQWVIGRGAGPIAIRTSTAFTPRLIACYRWQDEGRTPSFWRGIANDDGWYTGGELGITWNSVALDVALTWNHGDGPHATLAYGLAF